MVFLAWTEPPIRPDDPRRTGRVAPCAARFCNWPAAGAEAIQGRDQALRRARTRTGLDDTPCLVAVGTGETPSFVEAAGKTLRHPDDSLAVVPSHGHYPFDAGLLCELAERAAPRQVLAYAGAVRPDGSPAELSALAEATRRYRVVAVVDATLAPWTTAKAFANWVPHAIVAALDRWHDEPLDRWGLAMAAPLGTRTSLAKRTALSAARLRTALTGIDGLEVGPAPSFETGTISIRFAAWAPEEAATMLREGFGLWVGGPPATPSLDRTIPPGSEWLRLSVAPATRDSDLSAAVAAISRVAGATVSSPLPSH